MDKLMKSPLLYIQIIKACLWGLLTAPVLLSAQSEDAARTPVSFGLPRLVATNQRGAGEPLPANKVTIDRLIPDVGAARSGERLGAPFLSVEAGVSLSRPLRGTAKDVLFVSFSAYGSSGTIITIGGATLGIIASDIDGRAQLMALKGSEEWESLRLHVPYEKYEGKTLASLPVLTLRLDPKAGVFDVYVGTRMIASDIPLAKDDSRQFVITPGSEGAWLNGLVQSDENPLHEDVNRNGIDDAYERETKGRVLESDAPALERRELAAKWREDHGKRRSVALFFNSPRPDAR